MTVQRRAAEVVAIIACYLALGELIREANQRLGLATDFAAGGLVFYGLWASALALAAWFWPRPRLVPMRDKWTRRNVLIAIAVALATEWIYGFKVTRILIGDVGVHAPMGALFVVNAAIAAPLVEEWLFRGVLWEAIATRAGTAVAFAMTSLLFGIWHWASIFYPSWYGTGGSALHVHVLFGVIMATARWRLGAIGVGVVLHGLYNGLFTITA